MQNVTTLILCLLVINTLVMHGCSSTAASQEPQEVEVEFSSGEQQYAAALADTVEIVRLADEQVAVSGSMRLPNPCFEVKASGLAYADSLLLIIEATPTPQMCQMAETSLPYEVIVHSTMNEEQELKVRHTFTGAEHLTRTFRLAPKP